jgi:thioredoxin-disulfide reductase
MQYNNLYDLIVVGAGPAGLTAAIYMSRARYKTLVLEKADIGGQITITSEVVNYPGIKKTDGKELTAFMAEQAKSFGAEIKSDEVVELVLDGDIKKVITKNATYEALTVIIATGANPRQLGFEGESKFKGRGVAYCATCDGEFFTDKDIFVVGGGFAACEEGMFLTRYGKSVTMIVREEDFTCAKSIADKVKNHNPKINIHFNTQVKEITGDTFPNRAVFINNSTGEEIIYEAPEKDTFGTFVFAGYVPNTSLVKGKVDLDSQGYVITDENKSTNIECVFAAGDLCVKNLRQVVTATSDGAIAATSAEKIAAQKHIKLEIPNLFDISRVKIDENNNVKKVESTSGDAFITDEMKAQLENVFSRFQKKLVLVANTNSSDLGKEIEGFISELSNISENLSTKINKISDNEVAFISLENENGSSTGYKFVGVPGGHEFTSFVLSIYNYSGKGQPMEDAHIEKISSIKDKKDVKIVVSLSCTKCPDLVIATSQIMGKLEGSTFSVYDIANSPELREKYSIMSVPCMIINDDKVVFGKKNVDELLEIL